MAGHEMIAALYSGSAAHHRALHEPKYRRWLGQILYLPDAADAGLGDCDTLLVPERLHRGLLHRTAPAIRSLLDRGGTVVLFGEQPTAWLPGLRWSHRPTNWWWWLDGDPGPVVAAQPGHPLFDRLTLADMTWHIHGVFDPPRDAETVLTARDGGGAVLYIDRVSTAGTLIVTCLDPLWHFGSHFMPATERFLDGFLPWLHDPAA
ncbi:MAG: hypothetical protein ACRD0K_07645 [Egibacteraceae bacterium]